MQEEKQCIMVIQIYWKHIIENISNGMLKSYCASFALGLRQEKKGEGCPPRFHFPLHQMTCFGNEIVGSEAGLAGSGEFVVKAGCGCAVSSHFSGRPAPHSERVWTLHGSFSL